jgi:hypothetical protein
MQSSLIQPREGISPLLPNSSAIEEALRAHLGAKFEKLTLKEFNVSRTYKYPQGQMIRKTTITEIVRDGVLIKSYVKKGSINVF